MQQAIENILLTIFNDAIVLEQITHFFKQVCEISFSPDQAKKAIIVRLSLSNQQFNSLNEIRVLQNRLLKSQEMSLLRMQETLSY